jgi:hypothetical protein
VPTARTIVRAAAQASRIMMAAMAAVGVGTGSPSAHAELLYFKAGGQAQLPATVDGQVVTVDTPGGKLVFQRDDFRKIVPGHWPPAEWPERRTQAFASDAQARFEAAWWALENGLTPEAEAMLREAHAADPKHQPTARLVALLDRLKPSCDDPNIEELEDSLGGRFEKLRGPHVLLLHQHSPEEAAARVDVIERVVTTYYLSMAAQGFDLPVPGERLVAAWFAHHEDYLAYLHNEQADAFRTTTGYFHPTRDAVLSYDLRSSPTQRTSQEALIARRRELAQAREQLPTRGRVRLSMAGAPTQTLARSGAIAVLDRLDREVSRQQLLLDLDRRAMDLGTAAHETIHQLVAHTHLAPEHDDFPIWLHEGLAAQYEVVRGGRWSGLARAHDARLPDWHKIEPAPRLVPLLRDVGFGHGYQPDLYAQAWALVYYLRKQHPTAFVTFLDLLRTPDPDRPAPPDRTLAPFRSAFGADLNHFEKSWHQFMSNVQTPLESESFPR